MTLTDELRAMLDERGVEYETYDPPYPEFSTPTSDITTRWGNASYREWPNGTIRFSARGTTPEQAITATLVPGTCRDVHEPPRNTTFWPCPHFKCSECGATHVSLDYVYYCPNCGRKVVDE